MRLISKVGAVEMFSSGKRKVSEDPIIKLTTFNSIIFTTSYVGARQYAKDTYSHKLASTVLRCLGSARAKYLKQVNILQ